MFLSKRGRLYFFELAQQPVHDFRNRAPFYSYSLNSVDQFSFLGNRARYRAGVANFGKAVYPSLERSTQDTRDGFFLVQCAGLIFLAARWFRRAYSRPFWITSLSLSKTAGFVFLSGKASLVSISAAILLLRSSNVYFLLEFEFRRKSCVEWEHGGEDGISCLLPCIL